MAISYGNTAKVLSISGKWKQKCYILSPRNLTVTYLSHIEDDSHDLLDSMEKHLLDSNTGAGA